MNTKTLLLLMLFGCGLAWYLSGSAKWVSGGGVEERERSEVVAPDWIHGPTGVVYRDGALFLYAVGMGESDPSPAVRRDRALADGRTEMARMVSALGASCAAELGHPADEVDDDGATLVDELLRGSQQHRAWRNPEEGTYYVLMGMGMTSFLQTYEERLRGDGVTDGLDEQLARLRTASADDWNARLAR